MSVFTPVSVDEARVFVAAYGVGDIIDFQNIAAGVENSNFFVTTTQSRYVLTIFEKIPRVDLDFYMGLMRHLHQAGFPCAAPLVANNGHILQVLHGKPAALVTRLAGGDIAHPSPRDCTAVGRALAQLHAQAKNFPLEMKNWRGATWWRDTAAELARRLTPRENALLTDEIHAQSSFDALKLPRGIIHGDLFRDNILWDDQGDHHIPQMIDFYFACEDHWLFDVAITVNDWCLDTARYPEASLNPETTRALLAGYASVRTFTPAEIAAWSQMLRAAALRTWLGRLGYHHFPRNSELTHPKDHPFSERLLRAHIANESANRTMIESIEAHTP